MENYIDEAKLRKIIRETLLGEAKVTLPVSGNKSAGRSKVPDVIGSLGRIAKLIFTDPVSIIVFLVVLSYMEPDVYDDLVEFLTSPLHIFDGTDQALDRLEDRVAESRSANLAQAPLATSNLLTAIVDVPLNVISDVQNARDTIRARMSRTDPQTNTPLGDVVKFIIQALKSLGRKVLEESFILILKEQSSDWKSGIISAADSRSYIKSRMIEYQTENRNEKTENVLKILRMKKTYTNDEGDETTDNPFSTTDAISASDFPESDFINSSQLDIRGKVSGLEDSEIRAAFEDENERSRMISAGVSNEDIESVVNVASYISLLQKLGKQDKIYDTEY